LIQTIKQYHPSTDLSLIDKAYNMANNAHLGQFRKSGEPYIIHPLCVALILAELELDKETIIAGLLHDIVEDTEITVEDVTREFNAEVALLVDGVTKLGQLSYSKDKVEIQAENLRKMFLAMAKDIRVILIKLADRLHNMRTMQYMKPEKQKEKSRETMDIYAPIAHRLGISKIKIELDDLSLRYLQPEVYKELETALQSQKEEREAFISSIVKEVGKHIKDAGIKAEIEGRVKHFFSIYKKMVNQDKTLDQIYDLFAVRIKVDTVMECYAALGVIHEMYTPIPGRFKDYIAMPKQNMYQSLHTTLIGPNGQPFEIQIRTFEMHRTAEYGIAAHWKYKEGKTSSNNKEEEKLSWLRQILEWQQDMSDNREFLTLLKTDLDLFAEQVYCFTPVGDVKTLPTGSTPVDFAYSIHSAVGNKMVGARVNGRQVPIDYQLKNGDRVEIVTSQNSKGPSRDWLTFVRSSSAKTKINQWFKAEHKEENIQKGKELLDKYCSSKGIVLSKYLKPAYMKKVENRYSCRDWDTVLASVGHGGLKESQVVNRLIEEYQKENPVEAQKLKEKLTQAQEQKQQIGKEAVKDASSAGGRSDIIIKGMAGMPSRCSRCCSPVPGDEIIGFITRGRGVSIHRTDCENIVKMPASERVRLIEVEWATCDEPKKQEKYEVEILIYTEDRVGVLVDIGKVFIDSQININSILTRKSKKDGRATVVLTFFITGTDQLNRIMSKIRQIDSVIDIERS
ncbi:MAG: RelA/SpoT family protein, partial [Lachnospiraceae bacterium]